MKAHSPSTGWPDVRIFAFDHRAQMEELPGATPERIGAFKLLCLAAANRVAANAPGYGILCDNRLGREALDQARGKGLWIGRPVEWPGSRPLELEPELGPDCRGLETWPGDHVVKVLVFCHPEDDALMWAGQDQTVRKLFDAAQRNGLQFLLEIIPSRVGAVDDTTVALLINRFYDQGIRPDWWKLEPMTSAAAWAHTCTTISARDPNTLGIVVLGLGEDEESLARSFRIAARHPLVKGFAVGRTIFGEAAESWFTARIGDEQAVTMMVDRFERLCRHWDAAREAGARDAGPERAAK